MFGFLSKKDFKAFLQNDFAHLRQRVDGVYVALIATLICVIATLVSVLCVIAFK